MITLKKKVLIFIGAVTVSVWAAFNFNLIKMNAAVVDLTLANVEALALDETDGTFPACQKKKGDREKAYIPFCVNGSCKKNTWENKGTLDVNYCS